MILYLTDSLRNRKGDDHDYLSSVMHCLRNLANAHLEGKHILRGDEDILLDCKDLFAAEAEISQVFNVLACNYTSNSIPPDITYLIEIVREDPVERTEGDRTIAQRCIEDFRLMDACLASQLACEDYNDCEFYRHVLEWYVRRNNLRYNVNLNDLHGGGGRTFDNVNRHWRNMNQEVLCIVDTDRKYPGMQMDTTKCPYKCSRFDNQRAGYRCVDIDVHEVENLVPLNYIDNLEYKFERNRTYKKHFDYLRDNDDTEEILKFFDFKNGIPSKKPVCSNQGYYDFAKKCWRQNPEICTTEDFDVYLEGLGDDDKVYERLSTCVLRDTLEYIRKSKRDSSLPEPILLGFQDQEWNRIGKEMVNWGCARNPEGLS